jgi:MFS family permease
VLAAVMGTAAVVTPLSGALLDRFRAKPILITGNLASALGYAAFAFVDRPWQAFVCSAVGGAGFGLANTANQVLTLTLVSAEHRASSIALRRVAGNFGLGSGATVAGFIVASAHDLRAFQALYLFDGVTFAVFALVVLVGIPNPRLANAASASDRGTGFRAVAHDRLFLILIAASPIVADLAPPRLFGRYMSLYGLSFTAGVALGPAVGGALLATSPDADWWGGALAVALTGAGLLRLGDRIPDPLLQARCRPPQAVSAADMTLPATAR